MRGVLELVMCVLHGLDLSLSLSFSSLFVSFPFFSSPSILFSLLFPFSWGLFLFIEALVLFPKNEQEGRQQLAILKGNI